MAGISRQLQTTYPDTNKNIEARLMTFNQRFNGGPIRLVFLSLLGAVGFVLLIACANVANLLLARSAYRAREMAVRTALGASRGRIVRQLLIESVMLACIGGVLGLALASVGIRLFDAAVADVGKPYWIDFTLDLTVFGYFAVICLATGIVFGLAPALQVSKTNLNDLMKEGGRGQSGGARARWLTSTLVVGELALTLALLTGAGLMARSFLKLYSLDLGFETGHVLAFRTQLVESKYPKPEERRIFFDALQQRIRALPGVTHAALASTLPLGGTGEFKFEIEGQPFSSETTRPRVAAVDVGPGYFETLGVAIQRGRTFVEADGAAGAEVIVINRRLATEFFAATEPLGRRIRLMQGPKEDQPGPWLTIVGISPTIRQGEVQALEPAAVLYKPSRMAASLGTAMIVRTAGDPRSMIGAVREAAKMLDPDQPLFDVRTLDEFLARNRWQYAVFGTHLRHPRRPRAGPVLGRHLRDYLLLGHAAHPGARPPAGARRAGVADCVADSPHRPRATGHRPGARPRRRLRGQPGPQIAGRADPRGRSGHIHRHHGAADHRDVDRLPDSRPACHADGSARSAEEWNSFSSAVTKLQLELRTTLLGIHPSMCVCFKTSGMPSASC